jgi:uncharacterized membrane protein (DUF4010 family)
MTENAVWLNLAVALGIGLLIGTERERSKVRDQESEASKENGQGEIALAGIRTFTMASILGAITAMMNFWLLLGALICVALFASVTAYVRHDEHRGLATDITLVFTMVLGALSMTSPALAASLAVCVAILLSAKESIHGFVLGVLTKEELNDFLILAGATLIILPLIPNQSIGPFEAINPRNLWLVVILVMAVGAFGHLALRLIGGRIGLPLVGFVSGFISSIATISAMGHRAREMPTLLPAAVAGAVLSSFSTILQTALILAAISPASFQALLIPLIFGGAAVLLYGAMLTMSELHHPAIEAHRVTQSFSVKTALLMAGVIGFVLVVSAGLNAWFGQAGLVAVSAVAGLADAHAPTMSVASLVATHKLMASNAAIPVLVALSVNAISKVITAAASGGKTFAWQVVPSLVVQVGALWLGWILF